MKHFLFSSVQSCFASTETIRLIRDGEPRTATSTFTQLLSSEKASSFKHLRCPGIKGNNSWNGPPNERPPSASLETASTFVVVVSLPFPLSYQKLPQSSDHVPVVSFLPLVLLETASFFRPPACHHFICLTRDYLSVQTTCLSSLPLIIIIIMYIYHALINALSAYMIHINLNTIFYTHVEHLPKQFT